MGNSRAADKFVVRLPDGVRACIDEAASDMHTSMNAFVVQAIEEKLARGVRQELLLDALEKAANGPGQVKFTPRLIGWRTADYLMETADKAVAADWSVHFDMLPIFEGDAITKLPSVPPEASA